MYTKQWKKMACVSAAIILVGIIVGIFTGGLNVGIDFTGGTLMTVDLGIADYDMKVVEDAVNHQGQTDAQIVKTGNTTSNQTMANIRLRSLDNEDAENAQRLSILDEIRETYPTAVLVSVDRVDGIASADLVRNAILSIVIAVALILIYIWIRFELRSGMIAIVMLLHDVLIMLSLTCILRIPVNSSFIAAILTIVGYSINNTIVIFDRVRENSKNVVYLGKYRDEIVNKSIRSTIGRSINTTITTLIAIVAVFVLGVSSIKEFTLPIIIGLVAGAYSSIFLAAPSWAAWYSRDKQKDKKAAKTAKNGKEKKK